MPPPLEKIYSPSKISVTFQGEKPHAHVWYIRGRIFGEGEWGLRKTTCWTWRFAYVCNLYFALYMFDFFFKSFKKDRFLLKTLLWKSCQARQEYTYDIEIDFMFTLLKVHLKRLRHNSIFHIYFFLLKSQNTHKRIKNVNKYVKEDDLSLFDNWFDIYVKKSNGDFFLYFGARLFLTFFEVKFKRFLDKISSKSIVLTSNYRNSLTI